MSSLQCMTILPTRIFQYRNSSITWMQVAIKYYSPDKIIIEYPKVASSTLMILLNLHQRNENLDLKLGLLENKNWSPPCFLTLQDKQIHIVFNLHKEPEQVTQSLQLMWTPFLLCCPILGKRRWYLIQRSWYLSHREPVVQNIIDIHINVLPGGITYKLDTWNSLRLTNLTKRAEEDQRCGGRQRDKDMKRKWKIERTKERKVETNFSFPSKQKVHKPASLDVHPSFPDPPMKAHQTSIPASQIHLWEPTKR